MLRALCVALLVACSPAVQETRSIAAPGPTQPAKPTLDSWNDSAAKRAIVDFVAVVTDPRSPHFVPEAERIAVFDNDGTLWAEKPAYFQLFFAIDRVKTLAPEHPEWATTQPFKGALEGDLDAIAATGIPGLKELLVATHSGLTTEEFERLVKRWLETARHPERGRPYTELVYQPMLEVLLYLRAHGFKTFVVSGSGIEFIRVWVEEAYGIPPEQVIGTSLKVEFQERNGEPVLVRLPEFDFVNVNAGKPVGIHKFIGRRPILAFGNSDGDFQMLQWVTAAPGRRLAVIIHHTDGEREWAYDRKSQGGRLDRGLDEAAKRGWVVVDMKNDWNAIFAAAPP